MNDSELKEWQTQSVKHKVAMVLIMDGVSFSYTEEDAANYNELRTRWNAIWQEPEMTEAWQRVEQRKEQEAKEKARQEAEAKRESEAQQNRYMDVLDKFIDEGHEALSSFVRTGRVNFDDKEAASIYYGIMATAAKKYHRLGLTKRH